MAARLTASLREAPATVPALGALVLFVVWAGDQDGYPLTHWAPGGLIVGGLLLVAIVVVGPRFEQVPTTVRVALLAFALYTAWSFLSILWAAAPGVALEGADRTLLYLLVFALFAWWRQSGGGAALMLVAWTLALAALAAFVALQLDAAGSSALQSMIQGGRLVYPSGYANANAAQWLMAAWPALLLARERTLPWPVRGLLAGAVVLLAEVALLSQSRGSLYATPVMLVLVFAFVPDRLRTFAVLIPVAAGIAAAAPAVLRVGDHLRGEAAVPATLHHATVVVFAAAVAVALLVALAAALEQRVRLSARAGDRLRRATGAIAVAALVALLAGGMAIAGNPIHRLEHAWHSFQRGYTTRNVSQSRLVSGLGSNRYDFFRVALDEFRSHPLLGIGADNFEQQYLVHGRSEETPHYPHSVELRTLTDTGLVGTLIALVGLGASLVAGAAALRRSDQLALASAAAALAGFAYWVVHGSFDWFWEFAGLGASAFALLGISCALAPARLPSGAAVSPPPSRPRTGSRSSWRTRASLPRVLAGVAAIGLAAFAVLALVGPWLSQLELESAAGVWTTAPKTAYGRLDDSARLDPLSDAAYLLAGSIALRYGELARAQQEFTLALSRSANDSYATLELGAIASARGDRGRALTLLTRAARLDPRNPLVREALHTVRSGRRVSITALDRAILAKAQQFV